MNQDLTTSRNCYSFIASYIVDKKLATYSANKNGVRVVSAISRITITTAMYST
ncbi:hypothetical protein [Nitrosomonas sp.]|uniref:hypothetical protein n=1 Tax=Nitrosomonas sp. TaxID=42353 RepID=UPI002602F094|nr:hypothetical protein [Nitrosomonas sp.]MCW5602691.1 hypothetical protein [Nitrosomonas sp.]